MTRDTKSLDAHNSHYVTATLSEVKASFANGMQINPDNPLPEVLSQHGRELTIGVDIGAGHGWASDMMAQHFKEVYAIEPSMPAQQISKALWPNPNIRWVQGHAEEALSSITLSAPALFVSLMVLSHLEDETVIQICEGVNKIAKPGSRLAFNENWNTDMHERLWHSRTTEWWNEQFPDWDLSFRRIPGNRNNMFKSFTGVRRTL